MKPVALPLLVLIAAAALAGCEKKSTVVSNADGSKTEITRDGDSATITTTTDNGTATMNVAGNAKWPAGIADYAPAYPGGVVTASFSGNSGEGEGGMVSFTTTDSPDKIVEFYKARAAAAGLKNVSNIDINGAKMFGANDEKSGRSLSIQASVADGKTNAAVTFGTTKK